MNNKYIQICEYDTVYVDKQKSLDEQSFRLLKEFVLKNNTKNDSVEIFKSVFFGGGEALKAQNYVGVISLKNGTSIDILPKIYLTDIGQDKSNRTARELLCWMLASCYNLPYKKNQFSNVGASKTRLIECFIKMFIDEVFEVLKKGVKHGYETVESNELFFKGRLKVSQHIRQNFAHKERNYVEYDIFSANCPENRLLKSTLQTLYKVTANHNNKAQIMVLLSHFDLVNISNDYKADFKRIVPDRKNATYTNALKWCEIFLNNMSFTPFSGDNKAFSLLFPMEKLFESYVATLISRKIAHQKFNVSKQDAAYYLIDEPRKLFSLRPDIVIREDSGNKVWVLDTKWKLLSQKENYGISQSDMYQMYAYYNKYRSNGNAVKEVILIYPLTKVMESRDIYFESNDNFKVKVMFVDFSSDEKEKHSIDDILKEIEVK